MPSTPAAFSASSTPACRFAPSITISGGIAPAAAILASWPSFALKLQRTCATALHRLSKCDVRNETSRAHELLIDHIIVASNGLQCVQHTHQRFHWSVSRHHQRHETGHHFHQPVPQHCCWQRAATVAAASARVMPLCRAPIIHTSGAMPPTASRASCKLPRVRLYHTRRVTRQEQQRTHAVVPDPRPRASGAARPQRSPPAESPRSAHHRRRLHVQQHRRPRRCPVQGHPRHA